MKQVTAAVVRLLVTFLIVSAVVFVNRSQGGDEASAETVRCDLDPPGDVAGLETCLARSPRDVEILLELSAAYEAAGRHAEARVALTRAAAIDPRDAGVRQRLAR